jgi:hypothetical protein
VIRVGWFGLDGARNKIIDVLASTTSSGRLELVLADPTRPLGWVYQELNAAIDQLTRPPEGLVTAEAIDEAIGLTLGLLDYFYLWCLAPLRGPWRGFSPERAQAVQETFTRAQVVIGEFRDLVVDAMDRNPVEPSLPDGAPELPRWSDEDVEDTGRAGEIGSDEQGSSMAQVRQPEPSAATDLERLTATLEDALRRQSRILDAAIEALTRMRQPRFRHVEAKRRRRRNLLSKLKQLQVASRNVERYALPLRWLANDLAASPRSHDVREQELADLVTRLGDVVDGDSFAALLRDTPDHVESLMAEGLRPRIRGRSGSAVCIGSEVRAVISSLTQVATRVAAYGDRDSVEIRS